MSQPTITDIIEILRLYIISMNPTGFVLAMLPGSAFDLVIFILYTVFFIISLFGVRDVYQHYKLSKEA